MQVPFTSVGAIALTYIFFYHFCFALDTPLSHVPELQGVNLLSFSSSCCEKLIFCGGRYVLLVWLLFV